MATLSKINIKPACDIKAALLPVLGLCGKSDDPIRPSIGAFCIDSDGKDLVFWTHSHSALFTSKIEADELTGDVAMTIRPSCFGLLVEHIKKARIRLEAKIIQDSEDTAPELHITSENGTLVIADEQNPEHPDPRKFLKCKEELATIPAYFIPKKCLPFLNAFKNVQYIDVVYSASESDDKSTMRIRTTHEEFFVRFEALILGCYPSHFKQE